MVEIVLASDKSASAIVEVPVVFRVMVRSPPESVTASLNPNVVLIASAILYSPASVVDVADVIVGLVTSIVRVLELSDQSPAFPAISLTVASKFMTPSVAKPVKPSMFASVRVTVAVPAVTFAEVIVYALPIFAYELEGILASTWIEPPVKDESSLSRGTVTSTLVLVSLNFPETSLPPLATIVIFVPPGWLGNTPSTNMPLT